MHNLIYTIDSQVYLDWLVWNTVGDYEGDFSNSSSILEENINKV